MSARTFVGHAWSQGSQGELDNGDKRACIAALIYVDWIRKMFENDEVFVYLDPKDDQMLDSIASTWTLFPSEDVADSGDKDFRGFLHANDMNMRARLNTTNHGWQRFNRRASVSHRIPQSLRRCLSATFRGRLFRTVSLQARIQKSFVCEQVPSIPT